MGKSTMIRAIYAVNFSNIMFLTPLLYIINHPSIFNIGFVEETIITYIPFISISFMVFKNIARFANVLALFNNYIFGTDYYKILNNLIISLISILIVECYLVCFIKQFDVNLFSICLIVRQYLYGSIDYSLDQLDISYNQSYRVIGLIPLFVPIIGIIYKSFIILSLQIFYLILIIGLIYSNYLLNQESEAIQLKSKPIHITYTEHTKDISKRISIENFSWIFVMLIMVSYVDGAGDAIAGEKLWNSKDINYFIINQIVKIVASIITFPPIKNMILNNNNNNKNVTKLIVFRFMLLIVMNFSNYKRIIFFIQCGIDIYVGTIFMNDYLDKNKKIFWNSTTKSKYYVSASFAYFINENVPPFIKMILVNILTSIGKKIEIGLWFTIPIMIVAISAINMIPIIQKKIKKK